MAAICYSGPISVVPTSEQLLCEERTGAKFQIDSTDIPTDMAKSTQLIMLIIYVSGLRRFFLGVINFVANLIYPVQVINIRHIPEMSELMHMYHV